MANSNQIDMRIIENFSGIIGICIMAANVLCIFVILCFLLIADQFKALVGPSQQIS